MTSTVDSRLISVELISQRLRLESPHMKGRSDCVLNWRYSRQKRAWGCGSLMQQGAMRCTKMPNPNQPTSHLTKCVYTKASSVSWSATSAAQKKNPVSKWHAYHTQAPSFSRSAMHTTQSTGPRQQHAIRLDIHFVASPCMPGAALRPGEGRDRKGTKQQYTTIQYIITSLHHTIM